MSLPDFRFGEAGWFLLVFIVSFVSIIITTVNNNIYNYSYKYKKKHKLLNQISKWKTKKKKHFRPNTFIDLLRDILLVLLFTWNNRTKKKKKKNRVPLRPPNLYRTKKKKKKHRVPLRPTNLLLLLLTMTTYTVAANELEGVIIRFAPHPDTAFRFFIIPSMLYMALTSTKLISIFCSMISRPMDKLSCIRTHQSDCWAI